MAMRLKPQQGVVRQARSLHRAVDLSWRALEPVHVVWLHGSDPIGLPGLALDLVRTGILVDLEQEEIVADGLHVADGIDSEYVSKQRVVSALLHRDEVLTRHAILWRRGCRRGLVIAWPRLTRMRTGHQSPGDEQKQRNNSTSNH